MKTENKKKRLWTCLGSRRFRALFVFFLGLAGPLGADDSVALKYTYRPETTQVQTLHDIEGRTYLPLNELAQFYGIQMDFDPQSRRITLSKGKYRVRMVLSQPLFLTFNPEVSYPIDPAEVVAGRIAVTPDSAQDILGALLNINVRYQSDEQALLVGGIKLEEIKNEIREAGQQQAAPSPAATAPLTQALILPTSTPEEVVAPEATGPNPAARNKPEEQEAEGLSEEPPSNQSYRVRRVVIDPGHGGRDSGAKGYTGKFFEKQATLDIAERVKDLLKKDGNLEVLMTRTSDKYISLKDRTDFANRHHADLFVSIHCNSNPWKNATGTETYIYGNKPSNKLAAVAAVSEGTIDDAIGILSDLGHRLYEKRSESLAEEVDSRIRERLKQHIRQVHKGPFYVLRQVDMPSILIETAFISNRTEENKLRDPYWRNQVAKAIADGILAYRNEMNSAGHGGERVNGDENIEARR